MTEDRIPTPNAQAVLQDQTAFWSIACRRQIYAVFLEVKLNSFAADAFRLRINVKNAAEGQPHSKVVEP